MEGAFVFAKQTGYAPYPSTIVSINKSRTSAIVKYLRFCDFTGVVKINEIVQVDDDSMESISALVSFTLKTKGIKDFLRFERGIQEAELTIKFECIIFFSFLYCWLCS